MSQQYSIQALAANNMANVEAMRSLAVTSLKATERLLALNLDLMRTSFGFGADPSRPATDMGWQDMISRQGMGLQQTTEKAAAYLRGVYDISAEAQAEVSELMSSRVGDVSDSVTSLLDTIAQSGPAGSESAIAVVKSAIANTRSAYDHLVKTAQQVTEANAAAVGNAAKTMGAANQPAKAKKAA